MSETVRWASGAAFLLLWGMFSYSDFRWQKIRNRVVLGGFAFGALAYLSLAIGTWRGQGSYLVWEYYLAAARHAAAAVGVAVGLWMLRVWPAGDAKLFAMTASFLPLIAPEHRHLPYRAILVELMNIFIPAALFIAVGSFLWVWRTRIARRFESLRELGVRRLFESAANSARGSVPADAAARLGDAAREALAKPGTLLWSALDWLGFFAVAGLLMTALSVRYGEGAWTGLAVCAFSFFVWSSIGKVLGRLRPPAAWAFTVWYLSTHPELPLPLYLTRAGTFLAFGLTCGLAMKAAVSASGGGGGRWWLWAAAPMLLGLAGPLLHLTWGMMAFAVFLGLAWGAVNIASREDTLDWKPAELKPWLVLTNASWDRIRRDEEFYDEWFETRYADGLTPEQAEALRDWCSAKKIENLTVQKTVSFAFWIFAGVFLTAALEADILNLFLGRSH